jgi:TRAP-type C4-dicarboxylate transport system substrate-binding protein
MHASVKIIALLLALATVAAAKDKPKQPTINPEQTQEMRAVKAEAALIQERTQAQLASLIKELSDVYSALDASSPEGWCFIVNPRSQPQEQYVELAGKQTCDRTNHRIELPAQPQPKMMHPIPVPPPAEAK